jgi:hypothetical protein
MKGGQWGQEPAKEMGRRRKQPPCASIRSALKSNQRQQQAASQVTRTGLRAEPLDLKTLRAMDNRTQASGSNADFNMRVVISIGNSPARFRSASVAAVGRSKILPTK